ncbi:unnamed protein product [Caretta caretta]
MATAAAPCRSPDSPTGSTCGSSSSSTWRCSSSSICCPEPAGCLAKLQSIFISVALSIKVAASIQDDDPYL